MKIFNGLLALMFLSFAALQYNDPDPWLWMLIYGLMTGLCVMAVKGKYYRKVMLGLAMAYIIYAAILSPGVYDWWTSPDRSLLFDDLAKMQYYYIEEAREFLGLIICLSVIAFYLFLARKSRPSL